MQSWDIIIIGGGFLGLSTAYQLARMGTRTLVLEAGDLGGGTSSANAGRAQVNEGHLDPLNLQLIHDGLGKLETLQDELEADFEWHRLGYLCLIKTPELWDVWTNRADILSKAGIPTEVLGLEKLYAMEPHLNTDDLLGAAYSVEGVLNPFLFNQAFIRAAQRCGAEFRSHNPATDMRVEGRRIVAVEAGGEWLTADNIVVMSGAWTPAVTRLAGVDIPIRHTHAEAFITEPLPHVLNNTIGLADFYEIIHGKEKAVAIGIGPHKNGTLLVTEAVAMTTEIHRRNSAWGLSGMVSDLLHLFPILSNVQITRAWGSPTAFTPDEEPAVGWMPQFDNLFVGSCLLQTITTVPLISEWMAMMIRGETPPVSLDHYSPARFYNSASQG
jgi:glycine/D-amino acid oxidase-like deaminating enzyme